MFPTYTLHKHLPHTPILDSIPEPTSLRLGGALTITIEGLYVHLVVVKSLLRLSLVSWVSYIERVYPSLWLSHELGLHLYDEGNLGAFIAF